MIRPDAESLSCPHCSCLTPLPYSKSHPLEMKSTELLMMRCLYAAVVGVCGRWSELKAVRYPTRLKPLPRRSLTGPPAKIAIAITERGPVGLLCRIAGYESVVPVS